MRAVRPLLFCASVLLLSIGASAADRDPRPWFEQVERDRDRGAGRVEEQPSCELRRLRDARAPARREFERIDEETDRRLRVEARRREAWRTPILDDRSGESVILSRPPGAPGVVMSPMAAQAAADERALAEAKEKLDRSLRAVNAAEQRALRSLRRRLNREGRVAEFESLSGIVRERHERLRAGHRVDYQRTRSRILGRH